MRRTALRRLSWQTDVYQRTQIEISENFDNATRALQRLNNSNGQDLEVIIKGSYQSFLNTTYSKSEKNFQVAFSKRKADFVAMRLWKAKLSRRALDIIRIFQGEHLHLHNVKFLVEPEELEENIPSSIREVSICEQNVDRYVNKFLKELFKRRELAVTMKRMPFRSFKILLGERLTVLKLRQVDSFSERAMNKVLAMLHKVSLKELDLHLRSSMPGTVFSKHSYTLQQLSRHSRSRNSSRRNQQSIQRRRQSVRRNRSAAASPRTRLLQNGGEIIHFEVAYSINNKSRVPKFFLFQLPSSLRAVKLLGYFPRKNHRRVDNMIYWSDASNYTLISRRVTLEQHNLNEAATYFL